MKVVLQPLNEKAAQIVTQHADLLQARRPPPAPFLLPVPVPLSACLSRKPTVARVLLARCPHSLRHLQLDAAHRVLLWSLHTAGDD